MRSHSACASRWATDHAFGTSIGAERQLVAGARLYARHNRLTRWVWGLVDHHQFDTSKDHEFTDWRDLRTFVDAWARRLEGDNRLPEPLRQQSGP